MQYYKSKWASRTWYAYKRVSKLSQSINHTQLFVSNRNTNAGLVTVWLQVCYMHLCCAYVLPWSVCARSAQHRAPAASHTGASHKGGNPYTPPHQNGLGEVQPSHLPNKEPKMPMSAIPIIAEYRYMKNPKGKNRWDMNNKKQKRSSQSGKLMGPLVCSQDPLSPR